MSSHSNIHFGIRHLSSVLQKGEYTQVHVLVDENTLKYCYPKVLHFLPQHGLIQITSGEEHKNLESCNQVWTKLTASKADRRALLINLGGGVIGDLGGFAAACYKRGIPFVNIPTTLLAMVDASVGGKTGVDFANYKNQIGVFAEPEAVIVDTAFLETLEERQLLSGFAEVIKPYLIADAAAFAELCNSKAHISTMPWEDLVRTNIYINGI